MGNFEKYSKKILKRSLLSLLVAGYITGQTNAANVLYLSEGNVEPVPQALLLAGLSTDDLTTVNNFEEFENSINSNSYKLIIYNKSTSSLSSEERNKLQTIIDQGNKLIISYWLNDPILEKLGAIYKETNNNQIILDNNPVFTGLISPINLSSVNYGIYNISYEAVSEAIGAGTLGNDSAIIFGNNNNSALIGPLLDTFADPAIGADFLANVIGYIAPSCNYDDSTNICTVTSTTELYRSIGRSTENTLRFSDIDDFTFDMSNVSNERVFRNFQNLEKAGSNTVTWTGSTQHSGTTSILEGILKLGGDNVLSPNSNHLVDSNGTLDLAGTNQTIGSLTNRGLIKLNSPTVGSTLTVNNNYVGENGTLEFNTILGNDNSQTDKLVVKGVASGNTLVKVNNIEGQGAQTAQGIKIIETSSSSDDAFKLNGGYVTAGVYDYSLIKKTEIDGDNWYLSSVYNILTPDILTLSPSLGSYLANISMVNNAFTNRLEDREGASQYLTKNDKTTGNLWIRVFGGHNKFEDLSGQLRAKGDRYVTQLGASLVTLGPNDQVNVGIMGGYGHYESDTDSQLTGRQSSSKLEGYSVGAYTTWYAFPLDKTGAYLDLWALWNDFDNTIIGSDENQKKFDSDGLSASIEVGGNYKLGQTNSLSFWIQPQAQMIYQGVNFDGFKDAQGTAIQMSDENLQTRLGIKTYLDFPTSVGANTSYRPYLALNWIHNTEPKPLLVDDESFGIADNKNIGEIKVGVEGSLTSDSQVWINFTYQARGNNKDYMSILGWKWNF